MWPVLLCWRGAQVEVPPLLPTVGADSFACKLVDGQGRRDETEMMGM